MIAEARSMLMEQCFFFRVELDRRAANLQVGIAAENLPLTLGKTQGLVQPDAQRDGAANAPPAYGEIVADKRIPEQPPALLQELIQCSRFQSLQFGTFVDDVFQKGAVGLHNAFLGNTGGSKLVPGNFTEFLQICALPLRTRGLF